MQPVYKRAYYTSCACMLKLLYSLLLYKVVNFLSSLFTLCYFFFSFLYLKMVLYALHVYTCTCIMFFSLFGCTAVDMNILTDADGLTPLLVAAKHNVRNSIVWMIQNKKTCVEATTCAGQNALHLVVQNLRCEFSLEVIHCFMFTPITVNCSTHNSLLDVGPFCGSSFLIVVTSPFMVICYPI